jgi:hypothetical protein
VTLCTWAGCGQASTALPTAEALMARRAYRGTTHRRSVAFLELRQEFVQVTNVDAR